MFWDSKEISCTKVKTFLLLILGFVQRNRKAYKDLLSLLWFTMYSRGGGIIGSSAFEHVFMGELKRDEVGGLHNWIFFANEEENRRVDYMGYLKKLDLGKVRNCLSHGSLIYGLS